MQNSGRISYFKTQTLRKEVTFFIFASRLSFPKCCFIFKVIVRNFFSGFLVKVHGFRGFMLHVAYVLLGGPREKGLNCKQQPRK